MRLRNFFNNKIFPIYGTYIFSMRRPTNVVSFSLSHGVYVNNITMLHDRLHCVCCLGDFSSLTLFVINKACIQYRTEIKLKSYKGILPCLSHFMCQCFTHVGLLLRLAVLSSYSKPQYCKPETKPEMGETSGHEVQ